MDQKICLLFLCMGGLAFGQAQSSTGEQSFTSVDTAIQAIRSKYGVATGLEIPFGLKDTTLIHLDLSRANIASAFGQITSQRPTFMWVEKRPGIFSLVPRDAEDNITALRIREYALNEARLGEASSKISELPEFKQLLKARGLKRRELEVGGPLRLDKRVSVRLRNVTLHDILDELVVQFGLKQWVVVSYGDSGHYVGVYFYDH